jgi:hypothetical protein
MKADDETIKEMARIIRGPDNRAGQLTWETSVERAEHIMRHLASREIALQGRVTHLEAEAERLRAEALGLCEQWEGLAALSEKHLRETGSCVGAGALQAEADTWRSCAAVLRTVVEESDG